MPCAMISIDTNILVRFFTRDDDQQAKAATKLLSVDCNEENPGMVTSIVLVELVWTLRSAYGYSKDQLAQIIEILLSAKELCFEHPDEVRYALELFSIGNSDFSDALIGAISKRLGCDTTMTFDARAAKLGEFTKL